MVLGCAVPPWSFHGVVLSALWCCRLPHSLTPCCAVLSVLCRALCCTPAVCCSPLGWRGFCCALCNVAVVVMLAGVSSGVPLSSPSHLVQRGAVVRRRVSSAHFVFAFRKSLHFRKTKALLAESSTPLRLHTCMQQNHMSVGFGSLCDIAVAWCWFTTQAFMVPNVPNLPPKYQYSLDLVRCGVT